jgi:uncharacterized protein (TIGR03663 family)
MANSSPTLQSVPHWRRNINVTLWVLFSVGVALALRSPRLDERPMHNDEAVNAIKFGRLFEKAGYRYDPNEHHGPTLYYATLWLAKLTRAPDFAHFTETRLRALTVLFGVGLILLLPLTVDGLGRRGTIWAAIFTAVSPAFVFYSRYYIHEMLLVFFAFLALAAGWRYWRSRRIGWALLAGAGVGLMYATKETFLITLAAAGLALAVNQVWNRLVDASGLPVRAARLNAWHTAAALAVCLLVGLALFSSFFTNASGPIDSIRTYGPWLNRAGGASEHIHPWNFYFHRLLWFHAGKGPVWTESVILVLAVIGGITGFIRKNLGGGNASFTRFLFLYTILLTAAYALIGYKTPWCLLNFWHPMILLAGVGAAVIVRRAKQIEGKIALATLLMAGAGHLFWQAAQAAIPYAADQRNPYAYAQTSPDVVDLANQLKAIAAAHPDGLGMVVKVISSNGDYWPLPWYLRQFTNVGWWEQVPADPFAPVMIVSAKWNAALDEQKTHLMVRYFALRPQVFLELYVQIELWRAYLATKPPESGK